VQSRRIRREAEIVGDRRDAAHELRVGGVAPAARGPCGADHKGLRTKVGAGLVVKLLGADPVDHSCSSGTKNNCECSPRTGDGIASSDSRWVEESDEGGFFLSDEETDWIEALANAEGAAE